MLGSSATRVVAAGVCIAAVCWGFAARAEPQPADAKSIDPVAVLVAPPTYQAMWISPDGKHIAALRYDAKQSAASVMLIDVDTRTERQLVGSTRMHANWIYYTRRPIAVHWIDHELLAVDFNDDECELIDMRGKTVRMLGERFIMNMTRRGSATGWVLVYRDVDDGDIALVHPRTGEKKKYHLSLPGKLVDWAFDASGALRAVTMRDTAFWSDQTKVGNWYRASEHDEWQLLEERPVTEEHWSPLYVPDEPDSLVVISRHERDTSAVFRYDVKSRRHVELMAAHASEDILAVTGLDQERIDRVRTEGLKPKVHWFDGRWAALQASVDVALPNQVNTLSGNPQGRVLVHTRSDVDAGRWFVLDTADMSMKLVARARPHLDPKKMRPMETMHYPSFDGLSIPAYLTRPAAMDGPAPMVVLIHGGPHVRDRWEWNEEVQVLASHGYLVFQPQFRGSAGFGRSFQRAGQGQWGLAMQDDITAGVRHLIARKIADSKRVCIVGASYGGYAALWGLVKTPELYRCGVSFAGVADIERMLKEWSDTNWNPVARELQRTWVGDLETRKQQFAEVSPLRHAAKIQVPVYIAHGDDDQRVPVSHTRKMVAALKEHGKQVELRIFQGEGHGLRYVANQYRYHADVLRFLKRHIGEPTPQSTESMK